MSEVEHTRGKLVCTNNTLEQWMEGRNCPSYYDPVNDLEEWFYGEFDRHAVLINGIVYEVHGKDIEPYEDIFEAKKLDDGDIEFEVKFYNGGCGFSEAIEEALKKIGL